MKTSLEELCARLPGPASEKWPAGERFIRGLAHGTMSVEFYERNAETFFRGSVDADMAAGWRSFAELLKPCDRVIDAGC